jgi:6-phosphogluconolactonase (cycloisomerase 2 family)
MNPTKPGQLADTGIQLHITDLGQDRTLVYDIKNDNGILTFEPAETGLVEPGQGQESKGERHDQ